MRKESLNGEEGIERDEGSSLFRRFDAATLMAVEGANGGEWAALAQVIVTFKVVFGEFPDIDNFADSCGMLCEADLIEYLDRGLALTPDGRKLLRKTGSRRGASRPETLVELLETIDERSVAAEGSVPEPTRADVAEAIETLTGDVASGLERVQAWNASRLPPPTMPVGSLRRSAELTFPFVSIDPQESSQ